MGHRDVTVRLAKNDDGDAVAALMEKKDWFQWDNWEIDWHDLEPNWLVAEHEGVILGCIQVVPAHPIGRIEVLCVDPDLGVMMSTAVVKGLTSHAMGTLMMYGSQCASSIIPSELGSYLDALLERDWIILESGSIVMRRLE